MKFCPECGKQRLERARFCQGCGWAYPGASNQTLWLGLSVVIFLSGATYFLIQKVIWPKWGEPEPMMVSAPAGHDEHDGHDHEQTGATAQAAAARTGGEDHASGATGTRFEELDSFFRSHQIIGPKVFMFTVKDEQNATLWLHQFPMDQMPQAMRDSFDAKVREAMAYLGKGTHLEIRDAQSRELLSEYVN